jgi:hypothetical protein
MEQITVVRSSIRKTGGELRTVKKSKDANGKGGKKMRMISKGRTKLTFHRPSPYPLPQSLLIGFWGRS